MPIVRDADRKKRYSVRKKSGCSTCKERHIKCGEEKPTCFKCLDARKKCHYQDLTVAYKPQHYKSSSASITSSNFDTASVSQFSTSGASNISQSTQCSENSQATGHSKSTEFTSTSFVSSPLSIKSPCTQISSTLSPTPSTPISTLSMPPARELDYYIRVIAPIMDPRKASLWITLLPQYAAQSKSIQNALIAMAGYYEYNMWSSQNLKLYNLAIQDLVQGDLLKVPAITRLCCCVLFIAIEWMQGNLSSSTELIRTGRRMILDYRKFEKTSSEQDVFSALESQFRALELHSNNHTTAARHIGWSVDRMPYYEFWRSESTNMRWRTVNEGHEALSTLQHSFILDRCHGADTCQEHLYAHTDWYRRFSTRRIYDDGARKALEIAWLQNGLVKRIAKLEDERQYWDEQFWDYYEFDFDLIIRLAECLDFSYDTPSIPRFTMGNNVTTYMFFVVHRCREPLLRRRALEIIRRAGSQAGMLKSDWVLKIACRIIELEEAGRIVVAAPDVPPEQRVIQTGLDWSAHDGTSIMVKYTFKDRIVTERLT